MFDLLLTGGWVMDGLGSSPYQADVGVENGRISAVGKLQPEGARVIDCSGRCISPGWVDIHGHADWTVLDHPIGLNLLIQGCTLTVAGNCGFSPAPVSARIDDMYRSGQLRSLDLATYEEMRRRYPHTTWGMAGFLEEIEKAQPGVNYVQLVGHNALRRSIMGHDPRRATEDEIQRMGRVLQRSLEEGAYGMSSGLVFLPGCWSDTGELIELARIVARHDGVYASHIRGERETNIAATQEFIQIAETAGVRAHMSHMQSKYPVFGNNVMKIEMLQQARLRGVDVTCDSESFPNAMARPATFLQIYHYTPEQLVARLSSPKGREEIKRRMQQMRSQQQRRPGARGQGPQSDRPPGH